MADHSSRRDQKEQVIHTPLARPAAVRPETAMSYGSSATQFSRATYSSAASTAYVRPEPQSSDEDDPTPSRPVPPRLQQNPHSQLQPIPEQRTYPGKMQMPTAASYAPPAHPPPHVEDVFASKLRSLLADDTLEKYIYWNQDGQSFRIRTHPNFTAKLYAVFATGGQYYVPIQKQLEQNGFQVQVVDRRRTGQTGETYEVLDCRRSGFSHELLLTPPRQEVPVQQQQQQQQQQLVNRPYQQLHQDMPTQQKSQVVPDYNNSGKLPRPTRDSEPREPPKPAPIQRPQQTQESEYVKLCRILRQRNKDLTDVIDVRENDYRILFNTVQEVMLSHPGFQQPFLEALTRHKSNNHYLPVNERRNLSDNSDSDDDMSQLSD